MTRIWKGKRILSLALALILLMTSVNLPAPIFAANEEQAVSDTTEQKDPMVGKKATLKTFSFATAHKELGDSGKIVASSYYPERVVITDVGVIGSTTYYQLSAASGKSWPKAGIDAGLTDGYWIESKWVELIQEPTISGVVKDSQGNPVVGSDGEPLKVTVTGDLPDGASVVASVPEINGEQLPNVFDIKVLKPDGTEWQPIDEGKTVTISMPVDTDSQYVDVIHFIDYAEAIQDGVEYWPIADADAEILEFLKDAILVSNREGCVAVEIQKGILTRNGIVTFETSSFSVYDLDGNEFVPSEQGTTIEFNNGLSGSNDENVVVGDPYYATPDTVFTFETTTGVVNSAANGTYFTVKDGAEYVTLTNERNGNWDTLGYTKLVTVTIDPNTPTGTSLKILYKTSGWIGSKAILREIIIVRPVEIKFDANLPQGIVSSNMPTDRVYSSTGDNRVITDGNLAHFVLPSNIPTATNPDDSEDTYTFVGWNTSPAGDGTPINWNGSAFNPTYLVPTKDMTLYAMWERADCTITFDHNNGTGTTQSMTVDYNESVAIPENPERPGYVFLGWSASEDGSGVRYQKGDTIQVKSNVTLHALWGVELYIYAIGGTISVQRDGDTSFTKLDADNKLGFKVESSTSNGVTTMTYYIVVPEGAYSNAYFRFAPTGSNKTIRGDSSGATMEFLKAIGTNNLNGDALISDAGLDKYTVITFTAEDKLFVSFDSAGGSAVSSQLVSKGDSINLDNFKTTRDGYDFSGWYDANGVKYEGSYTVNADITFTARWTPKKFKVTVNAGYGVESVGGAGQYDYSSVATVTATMRPGYWFVNWTGTGVQNSTSAEYTFLIPNGDVTLIANGELINYKITYVLTDANGVTGTNHADNPATYTIESGEIVLRDPVPPAGYRFVKWVEGNTIAEGSTGDKTFTAVWEPALSTLTIDVKYPNGADYSIDGDQAFLFDISADGKVILTVAVLKDGYVTIDGLTIGKTYTVTLKSSWSWRYGGEVSKTVTIAVGGSTVEFEVSRDKDKWLDGNDYWPNSSNQNQN